jgi:hypothetical protein
MCEEVGTPVQQSGKEGRGHGRDRNPKIALWLAGRRHHEKLDPVASCRESLRHLLGAQGTHERLGRIRLSQQKYAHALAEE